MTRLFQHILCFFLLSVIWMIPRPAAACDICGCGAGGYYFGVMPQFHKNFIGLRYRQASYDSHLRGTTYSDLFKTTETFYVTELWGRWYPAPRWQVLAFVPYQINLQRLATETKTQQGLGDMLFSLNYNLFNNTLTEDSIPKRIRQNLWVGVGAKVPTGASRFSESDLSQVANANFQLGTGSLDFVLSVMHVLRFQRSGISTDLSYKVNTANSRGYQFGNRVMANMAFFRLYRTGQFGLMPHIGAYGEYSVKDNDQGFLNENTGGHLITANLGLDVYYKRITAGVNYQQPIHQALAMGQIQAHARCVAHISFML
ncbi:hypothetical protein [Eisenibacter elegans]|uniref:hypothetical protein n=1 Tax=Eisenibacter elegans TaxID=997 RepID=UPI00054E423A|nr:hypothetical protein [Eisenibacter elegans]